MIETQANTVYTPMEIPTTCMSKYA
jgi:hypothetical protein